jgi:hypothetical protein
MLCSQVTTAVAFVVRYRLHSSVLKISLRIRTQKVSIRSQRPLLRHIARDLLFPEVLPQTRVLTVQQPAMNTYGGSGRIAPLILKLGSRRM